MANANGSVPDRPRDGTIPHPPASYAPWYKISAKRFVSVEHPYIIKNVDKGLNLLGGTTRLHELVQGSNGATAKLYLRPGDRMSKPLDSTNVVTNNIVLKVTVPKRTGLKRKRGSEGPYYEPLDFEVGQASVQKREQVDTVKDAQYLVRTMRENPKKYQVQAIGTIDNTHRFRGMPDFVFSSTSSPFMQKMHEHILSFDYEKMKGFTFDMSKGVKPNTEIVPPPRLSHFPLPFNYSYRQNPSVKQVVDELGNATTVNVHAAPKIWNQPVPFDVAEVPNGPADIPPVDTLPPAMQRLVACAQRLMEDRPIFTRRALMNSISGNDWEKLGQNVGKYIYQYVGYMFASGPWRDGIVRFGVDPRKDPECRKYQTMMFMLEKEPKDNRSRYVRTKVDPAVAAEAIKKKESHLFDGQTVSKDGKVWQVCDITDPFMKELLATTNLRKECDIQSDGWYHNGTWAKAKIFMKHKISDILEGMPSKDTSYAAVARGMPDIIMRRDKAKATMGKEATSLETHLATSIRASSLSYLLFNAERAARQGGGYEEGEEGDEEEEQDGEIETPVHIESGLLDPRLTEAGVEFERLEVRNRHDTGEEEDDDGEIEMAVDVGAGAIDPRLTEAVEELEKLVGPNENEIDDRMEVDGVEEE